MTLTSGNINQFKDMSNFSSLKQFNNHVEKWLTDKPFTKAETVAFKRLVRYSAKYAGVCNAKVITIVSATHNDGIGISRSTFERMLNKAINLGIITLHHTFKNGRKGHNVYVFNPYIEQDVSNSDKKDVLNQDTNDVSNETSNLNKTNNLMNCRKGTNELDHNYVSSNIPKSFVDAVKPFYRHAQDIYGLWNRLTLAANKNNVRSFILDNIDKYIKTFKESIYKLKQGKIKKSFFGYLYGAWEQTARHLSMQQNATSGIYFDWLSE